jgi:hypothetical protein
MRLDKSSPLQHVEMLRDRLSRQASAIHRKRRSADLKQGLPRTLRQAIKDAAADRVAERLEDIVELVVVHANQNAVILLHVKLCAARLKNARPAIVSAAALKITLLRR